MFTNLKKLIKDQTNVYSIEHGVGRVTKVFSLYDGIDDYIEVKFVDSDTIAYFPIRENDKIRIGVKAGDLAQALLDLGEKINSEDFEFETSSYRFSKARLDISYIVNVIASLTSQVALNPAKKVLLSRCLDSLVLEVSNAYETSINNAKGIVSDHMKCA